MSALTVEQRIRDVLCREFNSADVTNIKTNANFVEELGVNSQSLLNLILAVESEWSIEIDVDTITLDDVGSIGGLVRLVERHLKNTALRS